MGIFIGLGLVLTSQTGAFWQLFFTYSLFLAMGSSAIFVLVMSTVSRWFDRRRGLALGIASNGAGLGPLVMAPLATYLIASFDWRTAYLIIGVLAWVVVIPFSRLLRRDPYEVGALPDGARANGSGAGDKSTIQMVAASLSLRQAIRTRSFWMVFLVFLLFACSLFLVLTHLVPHATDMGFSPVQAASLLSASGGATVAGRVLLGLASDKTGRRAAAIICTLLVAVSMVWLIWARELWALYIFALAYGLGWGGMGPTFAALAGETFGLRKIGAILGAMDAGFNAGAAIGPFLGGLIFDVSGSYFFAFVIAALLMFIAATLVLVIRQESPSL
jgi:MFS family permease